MSDNKLLARSYRQYLTNPYLVGWLWPSEHAKLVRFLRQHDKQWYEKNRSRILPFVPIQPVEWLHPDAKKEDGRAFIVQHSGASLRISTG